MKCLVKLVGIEVVCVECEFCIEFVLLVKLLFLLICLNYVEVGYGKDVVILYNVGFGLEVG